MRNLAVRDQVEDIPTKADVDVKATIRAGVVPPTGSDGNLGEYWLDTVGNALYGPKIAAGAQTSVHTTQTTAAAAAGTTAYEVGMRVTCASAGVITALKYYRNAATTATGVRVMRLWNQNTAAQLATVSSPSGEAGTGWFTLAITPVEVTAGQVVVVSYTSKSSNQAEIAGGLASSIVNAPLTGTTGVHNAAAGGGTFPSSTTTTDFMVDVVYEAGSQWPVALDAVKTTGDTMTGDLTVASTGIVVDSEGTAFVGIDKGAEANFAQFEFRTAGVQDFAIGTVGTGTARRLKIYSAGTDKDMVLVDRATGVVQTTSPTVGGLPLTVHDTGWRNLNSSLLNGWTATGITLRRQGNLCVLRINTLVATNRTAVVFIGTPTGFVPALSAAGVICSAASAGGMSRQVTNSATNTLQVVNSQTSDQSMTGTVMWFTDEAWPATYPGTPA